MPCTTILVGSKASYDGSTMMARNEDSPSGQFTVKKFIAVNPKDQPVHYKSVISKAEIDLPKNPLRYTAVPNALKDEGIWGECGINEKNIAMSETETITSNPRVLGADPLDKKGIGEEDFLTIVLPYIHSAKEGVLRLGSLLEKYGTYEMNGIGFQDVHEIWWFESIGGHHWIAKRVPDDQYVVMPNQQGIDTIDLADAFSSQKNSMCSADLIEFIEENHLDLSIANTPLKKNRSFDARAAFGSHADSDHTYNTPRAWYMLKKLNPSMKEWNEQGKPEDDMLPWSMVPEHKITVEDIKYVLSSHYQGTEYDPYGKKGDAATRSLYRPIGISRNNFLGLTQLRPYMPKEIMALVWIAMSSNPFNEIAPFYANITKTPTYLSNTGKKVSTDSFYWQNRLIGALTDAHYNASSSHIERYQLAVSSACHALITEADKEYLKSKPKDVTGYLEMCNKKTSDMLKEKTDDLLSKVLYEASCKMKNSFSRSDA